MLGVGLPDRSRPGSRRSRSARSRARRPRAPPRRGTAVVVLPSVPVIPTIPSRRDGSPNHHAAASARAAGRPIDDELGQRDLGQRSLDERGHGPGGRGGRRRTSWPSTWSPGIATNRLPGLTARESSVTPRIANRAEGRRPDRLAAVARAVEPAVGAKPGDQLAERTRVARLGRGEQVGDRGSSGGHRCQSVRQRRRRRVALRRKPADAVAAGVEDLLVGAGQLEPLARRTSACAGTGPTSARPRAARVAPRRRRRRRGPSRPVPRGGPARSPASGGDGARRDGRAGRRRDRPSGRSTAARRGGTGPARPAARRRRSRASSRTRWPARWAARHQARNASRGPKLNWSRSPVSRRRL